MRCVWVVLVPVACSVHDASDEELDGCVEAVVGPRGASLEQGQATLVVPVGALQEPFRLWMCSMGPSPHGPGDLWEVGPEELEGRLSAPMTVMLHDPSGDEDMRIFVPYPDGPGRAFGVPRRGDTLTGSVYRSGQVWLAEDRRELAPFPGDVGLADVLLVVDISSCSTNDQYRALEGASHLLEQFDDVGVDYHLGVTTMDTIGNESTTNGTMGRLREIRGSRWLDPGTSDSLLWLEEALIMGAIGHPAERPFAAAHAAVELEAEGFNEGFVRSGASLAMVLVTDASPEHQTHFDMEPETFVDWTRSVKSNDKPVRVHGFLASPTLNDAYLPVVEPTGGVMSLQFHEPSMARIGDSVIEDAFVEPSLFLSSPADPASLEVWRLRSDTEPERFDAAVATVSPEGDRVQVQLDGISPLEVYVMWAPAES